jgi:hypothetical protein
MHSTVADLGTWAASLSGSALLSDELAAEHLETKDVGLGNFTYGLGMIQLADQYGHEGEASGCEGWADHDPATGETFVACTNTCSDTLPSCRRSLCSTPTSNPSSIRSSRPRPGPDGPCPSDTVAVSVTRPSAGQPRENRP